MNKQCINSLLKMDIFQVRIDVPNSLGICFDCATEIFQIACMHPDVQSKVLLSLNNAIVLPHTTPKARQPPHAQHVTHRLFSFHVRGTRNPCRSPMTLSTHRGTTLRTASQLHWHATLTNCKLLNVSESIKW